MGIKWNRESFLVSLVVVLFLVALGYYGYELLVVPSKLDAEASSQVVSQQKSLLATYPPEEALLEEKELEYGETLAFLPDEEAVNEALVILKDTANNESINLSSVTRVSDRQAVTDLSSEFVKSVYQVEIRAESGEAIRSYIRSLKTEDRVWSIPTFTVQKQGDTGYSGSFTLELMYRLSE